jgi:MFS family permease
MPSLLSPRLLLVFVASLGTTTSFYLLLTVVPLYATATGAGDVGAGFATGALMFSTVAAELAAPALLARFGYRPVLAAGLLLLGAPALLLPISADLTAILSISIVRGLGFAIEVVAGSALVASLVPTGRRGEGLGLYGIVVGVPAIVALPLGVWLSSQLGFPPVFIAGAVAALLGLAAVPGIPARLGAPSAGSSGSLLRSFANPDLVRPSVVFMASATAAGAIVTFLPLAVSQSLAPTALLAQSAAATASRWWAGRYGDRHGSRQLIAPALLAAALGTLSLALSTNPIAVLAGMVVFGIGFGISQNASLSVMFERVSSSGYGTVSALWNLAYDAGLGIGGLGFGLLVTLTSYPTAFGVTGLLMLLAILPALVDRRSMAPSMGVHAETGT